MLCIIALLMVVNACSNESKLKVMASIANTQCPVAADGATVESIDYNEDENAIQYHCVITIGEEGYQILKQKPLILKTTISSMLVHGDTDMQELVKEMIASNASLKFIYYNPDKSDNFAVVLSPEEMKQQLDSAIVTEDNAEAIIDESIATTNAGLPSEIEDKITAISMTKNDTSIVFNYKVEYEEDIEFDAEDIKSGTISSLAEDDALSLSQACVVTNRSIVYSYDFVILNKEYTVVITPDEIAQVVGNK